MRPWTSGRVGRPAGFSLVELLVVAVIIALLAALALPALAGAKERARRRACLNNQRQFLLVLNLYASDHADRLAPGWSDGGERQWEFDRGERGIDEHIPILSRKVRTNLVRVASGDIRFLVCPGLGRPFDNPGGYFYNGYGIVIGYNYLGGHFKTPWGPTRTTTNSWTSPQKLGDSPMSVVLADLNTWATSEGLTFAPHARRGPAMVQGDSRIRVGGSTSLAIGAAGGNLGRLDGSAEWKPARQMRIYRGSALFTDDGCFAAW